MRILYDGYIFSAQKNGGISRYFASLIRRLPADWTPTVRGGRRPNAVPLVHPRLRRQNFPFRAIRPEALAYMVARPSFSMLDRIGRYDLFHSTYHFGLPNDLIRKRSRPLVITVYDMIPEMFANELDPSGAEIRAKRCAIEAADAIICISQNTKRDLQTHYSIPDSRITVTYLASDISREIAFGSEPVPETPYFLFLGNRGIYKNFARTLLAFSRIAGQWQELKLCLIGDELTEYEVELIRALNIADRIKQMGYVNDTHLAKLYRCSEALVYPSLYEGFGIPPLEAMACGTVVITSDRASLPEVVGKAAIIVDPESVEEIAETLLSLKNLGPARARLIKEGMARASQFNWDATARCTIDLYRSLVG